jgi:hypothetical protein
MDSRGLFKLLIQFNQPIFRKPIALVFDADMDSRIVISAPPCLEYDEFVFRTVFDEEQQQVSQYRLQSVLVAVTNQSFFEFLNDLYVPLSGGAVGIFHRRPEIGANSTSRGAGRARFN